MGRGNTARPLCIENVGALCNVIVLGNGQAKLSLDTQCELDPKYSLKDIRKEKQVPIELADSCSTLGGCEIYNGERTCISALEVKVEYFG